MANLPIATSGGNASATAINSATSTNSSAWGTAQNVAFTATGQTLSLPTPIAGDIAPVLKTIVITNTGTNPFTIALTGGTITSAVGLVMNPGTIWTITAQTLTTANVSATNAAQGVVGESGTVYASANVSPTVLQTSPANSVAIPGLTFTAQDTQNYVINSSIRASINSSFLSFALFDSLTPTVPVVNTEIIGGGITAGNTQTTGTLIGIYALTAGRTYIIKCWNAAGNAGAVTFSESNGRCSLSWQKVTGQTPVTGQTVDYVYATMSVNQSTNINPNLDHIKFDTSVGNIPLSLAAYSSALAVDSVGRFTLQPGKTYQLEAGTSTPVATGNIQIYWRNADTGAKLPASNTAFNDSATVSGPTAATAVITPTVTTRVEVFLLSHNAASVINSANSYAQITQIGTSATTGFVGATQALAGSGGTVPTPLAGQQNLFLRGDGTWGTPLEVTSSYIYASISSQVTIGSLSAQNIPFNEVGASNGVSLNGSGEFLLQGGVTYELDASCPWQVNSGVALNGNVVYSWVDSSNTLLGTTGNVGVSSFGSNGGSTPGNGVSQNAKLIYTPPFTQLVKVRITAGNMGGAANIALYQRGVGYPTPYVTIRSI